MGTQPGSEPPFRVTPAPGSRLEQLLDQREAALAMAAEAQARADAITDGIKDEAATLAVSMRPPGAPVPKTIEIAGTATRPALTQSWRRPVLFDSKQLLKDDRDTWIRYAHYGRGHWRLDKAS